MPTSSTGAPKSRRSAADNTVLVVEDDPDIRDVLAQLLAPEGYQVAMAEHGEDALAWLRTHDKPCAILLDLMMPVMDGLTFLRVMRAEPALSGIPVVVLSAAGPDLMARTAHDVIACLPKPVEADQVLTQLSRARASH